MSISAAVTDGLTTAAHQYPLISIGIDAWAVDYGLLDGHGCLLADPICYRDERTNHYLDLVARIGERSLFETNGLQCLPINTIFQLDVESPTIIAQSRHLLTIPELIIHQLTGEIVAETTSAGSTGLVDQSTGNWSPFLLASIAIPEELLPEILPPGTHVGSWQGIPVHLVAGHDTASAVVGIPAGRQHVSFVSSGTWLLAGQELDQPILSTEAQDNRFTNEYSPEQTTRFLKNITGFWILERCRQQWGSQSTRELLAAARDAPTPEETFDATDQIFLDPEDMEACVLEAAGLPSHTPKLATVNLILNSLACTTASVIRQAVEITQQPIHELHVIGGGVQSTAFIERLEHHVGAPVKIGEIEAAVLGNTIVQGIALGKWANISDARHYLRR